VKKSIKSSIATCASAVALVAGLIVAPMQAQAATVSQLAGNWTAALIGNTGCGSHSLFVTITLPASGIGTASIQGHSTGCANSVTAGQTFKILTLGVNGQGTASLTCGVGCGWNFKIQVSADYDTMILSDQTDPVNTPTGTALRQMQ
jgi:hypothetical protein